MHPMPTKQITIEEVQRIRGITPTLRCSRNGAFVSQKEDGRYVVSLKLPSLGRLFTHDTDIQICHSPFGPYCFITDEEEIKRAMEWEAKYKNFIFLRDNLDFSMALDYNLESPGVYTDVGRAEHDAKIARDKYSVDTLATACLRAIADVIFYVGSEVVCSVPPSPDKDWDLPTELAKVISEKSGKPNISNAARFNAIKESIKAISLEEKWAALEAGELLVKASRVRGRKVILIDDKYQSGTTAQFVASSLYNADAEEVNGLFCVKTWRNIDNK